MMSLKVEVAVVGSIFLPIDTIDTSTSGPWIPIKSNKIVRK